MAARRDGSRFLGNVINRAYGQNTNSWVSSKITRDLTGL